MRELYGEAAQTLADGLGAQRVAIVYKDEEGKLALGGCHGFPSFSLDDSPISATRPWKGAPS